MNQIVVVLASLGLLYLTRKGLTRQLGRLVRRLGGGERAYVWLWSLIFLPGTVVHELSHFLAAVMTGARTGKIEIFPSLKPSKVQPRHGEVGPSEISEKMTHLGYVKMQRLGPVRGFLVGTAPLLVGLTLLIWLASTIEFRILNSDLPAGQAGFRMTGIKALKLYFFFTVANSLFPSWSDIKQALPLVAIGVIAAGVLGQLGVSVSLAPTASVLEIFDSLKSALWLSGGINITILAIIWTLNRFLLR